ncbi:MAG TPA: carboxypeptidase regulatory-like domain-containing protein, partial [Methanomassiliicoccaceae archaeon]|nr:carboxypeptidase regulatory-like domain-containing protein [Methanomassiliicoccaceae archaeon]
MMEIDKGRPSGQALKEKMPFKGGLRSRVQDTWLGRNWSTVLILVAIILIALFVRSYFGYATAVDNGFLVGGGSDSYYHQRVIEYVQETGSHLVNDPLLNYPLGMRNARPPLFDWSVAVTGQLLSGVTGMDISSATGYALLSSTAIWGALTCIPVFMITRAAFGNRAGLLAALLLAIMPGHVQRSVFANADHDAMILFFVVFAFYFLLRALMSIRGTKWVENWKSASSVRQGIKSYLGMNHRSLIYALLGGVCVATVAMIWTGFTYVLVIILVYLLVQVLINRFRNVDSMGELMVVGVMLASAFALIAPLYWQMNYWSQWFDVPFYLFLGSMVIGGLFTVSRDYPWTLTIPVVVAIVAVALIAVYLISPSLFDAIVSGQGYLVKSKLYSTIAEAQAPGFSNLALSFGAVTFWLAIIGLVWAAVKVPKNPSPHFIFVVVWMGVSMYMAASAQRFMFNAAPAFAMAAGWILALIIAAIKFEEVSRALSGFRSNPLATLRKAFKLRHVAGALFLALLIVAPNVWTAVDAGIPSETKRGLDKQIYDVMPSFLRPGNYNTATGSFWYLGAFTYSLPLPSTYWPTAWRWFSQQDSGVEEADRPAFLSWWDYGFEAIQQGKHPTVADNFQNGYQFAGSFITAGSEEDAVALMIIRLLEGTGVTDEIAAVMNSHGVDAGKVKEIMNNPSAYIDEVKNNPDVYGPYDNDLSAQNAKYAAARVELQDAGLEGLVDIYSKVREVSGKDIGYFAVDGRLFPFSASFNNIFYAPATLSDRVIDPYTNAPVDYYEIKAVTSTGLLKSVQDLTPRDMVLYYTIVYKDAFYKTMLYRAMMGYGPSDVGKNGQGIPGISGSLADMDPMPAWNLTHFKQVYRTAYYSPLNSTEAAQHPESWYAISYEEALQRQKDIEAGIDHGTVDLSASTLTSGVVFIQYYDGAILRGQATSSDGTPLSGIYVTAVDELGIPHHTVQTDEDGNYELILPFGDIKVVYSAGTLNKQTQVASFITEKPYNISYAQAMRKASYTLNGDLELDVSIVSGRVYWDENGNGIYDPTDEAIENATVVLENPDTKFKQEVTTNATGEYRFIALRDEGSYIYAVLDGHPFGNRTISLYEYGDTTLDIPVRPSSISGRVEFESGGPAPSVDLSLKDEASGEARRVTTDESGQFEFDKLLPGNYTLGPADGNFTMDSQEFILDVGDVETVTLTLRDATRIIGSVTLDGKGQGNVTVSFLSEHRDEPITATTDENGEYEVTLPNGNYTAYVLTSSNGTDYVAMQHFEADGTLQTIDLDLEEAAVVSGKVKGNDAVSDAIVIFTASSGSSVRTTADENGEYKLFLLPGTYSIYSAGSGMAFWGDIDIGGIDVYDLQLGEAASLKGTVYRDADGNRYPNSREAIAGALLTVTTDGRTISFLTDSSGKYDIILPKGSDYRLTISKSGYAAAERTLEGFAGKTENINMVALNQTVSGTVTGQDGGLLDGIIEFNDAGGGAADATAPIVDGAFSVSLSPGKYNVIVNIEEDGHRYVYNDTLTVPIGRSPASLDLIAQLEVSVSLDVKVEGGGKIVDGKIRFVDPDAGVDKEIDIGEERTYLVPGDYTIYAQMKDGDVYYAYLGYTNVREGMGPINIQLQKASLLSGHILDENGDVLKGTSKVTISPTTSNAELPISTKSNGEYQIYLPDGTDGTYTLSAELAMKKVIEDKTRYVVYTGSANKTISGSSVKLDVPTIWGYDN